jgi:hypothetical protein
MAWNTSSACPETPPWRPSSRRSKRARARYAARRATAPAGFKLRRYKDFQGGAKSWKCERRIIARIEVGPDGVDTRHIVTNLTDRRAQGLYERKYCQRGRMENLLKSSTWLPTALPA